MIHYDPFLASTDIYVTGLSILEMPLLQHGHFEGMNIVSGVLEREICVARIKFFFSSQCSFVDPLLLPNETVVAYCTKRFTTCVQTGNSKRSSCH